MDDSTLNKIMLVEDEEDIRTVAKFALEKRGKFTMKLCSSGKEALREVEAFAPDLILLDVMMPEMDGFATLKALREIPKLKHIPVIFMTAKVQASEVEQYRKLGALDVIPKPFNASTLAEQIRTIWKKHKEKSLTS